MKNLKYIDALRGIAVLGVLMVHCSKFGSNNYPFLLGNIFDNGAMGVQLFYVVSAFTLFLSVSYRSQNEKSPNRNFFIRRFFRIAPLYYLAVVYYLLQDGTGPRFWLGDMDHISNANIISNFFFFHGVNPYWINSIVPGGWSISVEMFFYCLIPLLATRLKNINSAILFFGITLAFKCLLDLMLTTFPLSNDLVLWNSFLYFYLPSQLPVFACGFILFFILTHEKHPEINYKYLSFTGCLLLLQLLVGFNSSHFAFAMGYVLLAIGLSKFQTPILVNRFTIYLGKISFSIYLIHFAVLHWMEKFGLIDIISSESIKKSLLNYTLRGLCLLVLSIIGATICYHLIEKPFQKVGKHLINRLERA